MRAAAPLRGVMPSRRAGACADGGATAWDLRRIAEADADAGMLGPMRPSREPETASGAPAAASAKAAAGWPGAARCALGAPMSSERAGPPLLAVAANRRIGRTGRASAAADAASGVGRPGDAERDTGEAIDSLGEADAGTADAAADRTDAGWVPDAAARGLGAPIEARGESASSPRARPSEAPRADPDWTAPAATALSAHGRIAWGAAASAWAAERRIGASAPCRAANEPAMRIWLTGGRTAVATRDLRIAQWAGRDTPGAPIAAAGVRNVGVPTRPGDSAPCAESASSSSTRRTWLAADCRLWVSGPSAMAGASSDSIGGSD